MKQTESIAKMFGELLKADIGEENYAEVIELNLDEENASVCHSHDFCDANMIMQEAMFNHGHDLDLENEAFVSLWNTSWQEFKNSCKKD